jgi:hypothetical protein
MKLEDVDNIKLGEEQVERVYLGDTIVWERVLPLLPAPIGFEITVKYYKTDATFSLIFTWDKLPDATGYSVFYKINYGDFTEIIVDGGDTIIIESAEENRLSEDALITAYVVGSREGVLGNPGETKRASVRKKAPVPSSPTFKDIGSSCIGCRESTKCDCSQSLWVKELHATAVRGSDADYVSISGGRGFYTDVKEVTQTYKPAWCTTSKSITFTAYSYNDGTASTPAHIDVEKNCSHQ